jgi:glucose/arabinose dehydrogenase
LYFSAGERGAEFVNPQDITRDNGKTASMRMEEFLQTILCRKTGAKAIYSYGHRNPQGLAKTTTGAIWDQEHGPKGGDEINIIKKR